jgi:organic hydroperoxide reductase OsmC/OhrA
MPETDIQTVKVEIRQQEKYRFRVDWGLPGVPAGGIDEPPPIGGGSGPNASRLVASAVAHCLSSSLLFCLSKSRVPADRIQATATAEIRRNDRGRWRLARLTVEIDPGLSPEFRPQFERCRDLFEEFCIVTESIRHGIPVDVRWAGTAPP